MCSRPRTRRSLTQLFAKKLVLKPVVFTRNRLVLVVPSSNPGGHPQRLRPQEVGREARDRRRRRFRSASYTLQVLKQMGLTSVLANVVSRESDVRSVLSKVASARRTPASSTRPTRRRCRAR